MPPEPRPSAQDRLPGPRVGQAPRSWRPCRVCRRNCEQHLCKLRKSCATAAGSLSSWLANCVPAVSILHSVQQAIGLRWLAGRWQLSHNRNLARKNLAKIAFEHINSGQTKLSLRPSPTQSYSTTQVLIVAQLGAGSLGPAMARVQVLRCSGWHLPIAQASRSRCLRSFASALSQELGCKRILRTQGLTTEPRAKTTATTKVEDLQGRTAKEQTKVQSQEPQFLVHHGLTRTCK